MSRFPCSLSRPPLRHPIACACVAGSALLVNLCLNGCAYYGQAVEGPGEILDRQRAIEEVMASSHAEADLKNRLALVGELRRFAADELSLPAGNSYTHYADLDRDHVVWSVFASPEYSLEPKQWWYPVAGRVSYRGYFRREMAERAAGQLEARDYDVFVGEVDAYSTLGWFRDPVLNTFIGYPDTALAELLFHELTHRRLYVRGDTDFNEALATAVAQEGVRRWLKSRADSQGLAAYESELSQRRRFYGAVLAAREELEGLYRARQSLNEDELQLRKTRVLERLAGEYEGLRRIEESARPSSSTSAFSQGLNNARINAIATYHRLVPDFEALLASEEGDFERFFETVKSSRRDVSRPRR